MKTSTALYKAADYIRAHGWKRGSYGAPSGPRCMAGAILSVVHGPAQPIVDCQQLASVTDGLAAEMFNDYHCKSADDAIAALEIAADIACAEGR